VKGPVLCPEALDKRNENRRLLSGLRMGGRNVLHYRDHFANLVLRGQIDTKCACPADSRPERSAWPWFSLMIATPGSGGGIVICKIAPTQHCDFHGAEEIRCDGKEIRGQSSALATFRPSMVKVMGYFPTIGGYTLPAADRTPGMPLRRSKT